MNWEDLPVGEFGAHANLVGVDPNLVWADATRFADFLRPGQRRPTWVPVIVALKKDSHNEAGDALARLHHELSALNAGSIPTIYPRIDHPVGSGYCTALFSSAYCDAVFNDPKKRFGTMIDRFELQMPVIPQRPRAGASGRVPTGPLPPTRARAGKTLFGVIDNGCPFAHRQLRDAAGVGTRVLNIWDQDAEPAFASARVGGTTPVDLGYGCEVSRKQLNAVMAHCGSGKTVAEDACYEMTGCRDLRARFSHGAAVLGLLAGPVALGERIAKDATSPPTWKPADDEASRSEVVFVQLPRNAVQDSSSAGLPRLILDGLRYILSCAGEHTSRIVVNISDGSSRGTHDGASIVEEAMVELVREASRRGLELHIVVAAGNSFSERRHAQFDSLKPSKRGGTSAELRLRLRPETEAPSYIGVRLPPSAEAVAIHLVPPRYDKALAPAIEAGQAKAWPSAARPICAVIYPALDKNRASVALIVLAPTTSSQPGSPIAPYGDWTIQLTTGKPLAEPVHFYVYRNQHNAGALRRGRQAYFVDADGMYGSTGSLEPMRDDPVPPTSPIRRCGTLSSLATVPSRKGIWAVGGYMLLDGKRSPPSHPASYSSAGPAPGGTSPREGPDVSALSDYSPVLVGIPAMGTRSGQTVRVTGTSFAVPQVARALLKDGKLPEPLPYPDPGRNGKGNLPP